MPDKEAEVDTGYSPDRWEFDAEVTRVFDDMLERSIPQYDEMRAVVTWVASTFAREDHAIVDLGCSRGEALARVVDALDLPLPRPWRGELVGAEVSRPMLAAARAALGDRARVVEWDLRRGYPPHELPVSVTLSVLTLMFVPVNYRLQLLSEAARATTPGGAFVLVEKVLGASGRIDDVLQATYHRLKTGNGYSPDDVNRKRLALEGVLVPLVAEWNEQLLQRAGFSEVDCFWAWGPFRAWVAVRGIPDYGATPRRRT